MNASIYTQSRTQVYSAWEKSPYEGDRLGLAGIELALDRHTPLSLEHMTTKK